jgi:hypothetical protein
MLFPLSLPPFFSSVLSSFWPIGPQICVCVCVRVCMCVGVGVVVVVVVVGRVCCENLITCQKVLFFWARDREINLTITCFVDYLRTIFSFFPWILADLSLPYQLLPQVYVLRLSKPVSTLVICRTVKTEPKARRQWLMPIILATQEDWGLKPALGK